MFAPLIQTQLAKDTPYAWFLYGQAKQNARYYLSDFQEQAEKLEAYLDALNVALKQGDTIQEWLDTEDWGCVFVLAVLGIRYNKVGLFDSALNLLKEDQETHYREIVDAYLWDKQKNITPWLLKCHTHPSPIAQQAALAIIRAYPLNPNTSAVQHYMDNQEPLVLIEWLNWLGEHQMNDHLRFIQQHYDNENPDVAFAAARAGLLLNDSSGYQALQKFALENNPHLLNTITLIFLRAENPAHAAQWVENLWSNPTLSVRVKLYAIAAAGLPQYVDRLFAAITEPETSRAAGEAFTLLTGADLDENDLEAADDTCVDCEDEDVAEIPTLNERRKLDPFITDWEDDLPYPCPDATANWWQHNRANFQNNVSYLAGKETTEENLRRVLITGNQRQRHLAALHLMVRYQKPWFNCGWPTWIQQQNSKIKGSYMVRLVLSIKGSANLILSQLD